MPIDHMATRPFPRDGDQDALEGSEVKLQHCKEYICVERKSRDKVLSAVEKIEQTRSGYMKRRNV